MGELRPGVPKWTDVNNREKILDLIDDYLDIKDAVEAAEDRVEPAQPVRPRAYIVDLTTGKKYTKIMTPY